jgi:hypothetical protein
MNDFTKEELQYLFRKFMLTNGDDFEHKLEAKLQSMIDNYCEYQCLLCRGFKCKPGICLIENRTYNENE